MEHQQGSRRFPWYRKVAFGTGHVLMVLAVSMWFSYSIAFFDRVIKLPSESTGTVILASQVFGAVATPFLGIWSDQCVCKYPGRRKIFHLMGNVAIACSFFFIWYSCIGCVYADPPYKVLYYASFAAVFQLGAAVQIATLSIIPELAKERSARVELNSIRFAFTVLGSIFVFVVFWVLLSKVNNSTGPTQLTPDDKQIFWIMAVVVILIGGTTTTFFQIFIKEDGNVCLPTQKWYKWISTPTIYFATTAFLGSRIVVLLTQSYLPLYLLDTLQMDRTSIAKGPLIQYISSFVITLLAKQCSKYVNDMILYFIGLALVWAALIWFWCADPTTNNTSIFSWPRDSIYGATILIGGGGAIMYIMSLTFISNVIGKYTGSSAFVYGWVLFCDRLMNGVVVKIVQSFQPHSFDLKSVANFYRAALVYVPFCGTGVGLISIAVLGCICWYRNRSLAKIVIKAPSMQIPSIQGSVSSETSSLLQSNSTSLKKYFCFLWCKKKPANIVEEVQAEDEVDNENDDENEALEGFHGLEDSLVI